MLKNRNYNRFFIMLQEEDKGFSRGGKPTGYVKVEMKDEKTKIFVHVQNIELSVKSRVLKAYLLSSTYPSMNPLCLGTIELKGSNGNTTRVFSKDELQKLGINTSLLDTAIITCKDLSIANERQYVPLIGFKNSRWEWKVAFQASEIKTKEEEYTLSTVETDEASIDSVDSAVEAQVTDEVAEEVEEKEKIPLGFVWSGDKEDVPAVQQIEDKDNLNEKACDVASASDTESISNEADILDAAEDDSAETGALGIGEGVSKDSDTLETTEEVTTEIDVLNDVKDVEEVEEKTEQISKPDLKEKDIQEQEEIHSTNQEHLNQADIKQESPLEDGKNIIFSQLQKYVKNEEPFNNGDMGYKWWTITDCAFILNNVYSDYNTAFLLYNPYVIDTIHRHNHFLFGIKTDEYNKVRFICYAIPSRYGIEPHPLLYAQAYAYWIPKKGERPVMGGLGYWVIIIDVDSGDLVFFNEDR